jgi:hypothetical protein
VNELERRLERTLTARADTVVAGARLSGDAVVAAGRTARRRRRHAFGAAVTAGALAVVVGATILAQTRSVGTAPSPPGSGAPASTPATPIRVPPLSPSGALPVASLGIDVFDPATNLVIPADGAPFMPPLPPGHALLGLDRVPDGWVMSSYLNTGGGDSELYVWLVSTAGEPSGLGRFHGGFDITADGRRIVVAGGADPLAVTAYELPSLRPIARVRIEGPGPSMVGIAGDVVVLQDAARDPGPTRAYTWNLRTGQLRASDASVSIWSVTDDGRVLRRAQSGGGRPGCVDLVAVADLPTVRNTGLCPDVGGALVTSASVSPDGAWALLTMESNDPPVWVQVTDLRAGRWRPLASGLPALASGMYRDTDQTVLVLVDQWEIYRCRPTEPCQRLATPAYPDGVVFGGRPG